MAFCNEDHPTKLDRAIKVFDRPEFEAKPTCHCEDGRVSHDLEMTIEKWQRRLGHYLDYFQLKNVGLGEALNLVSSTANVGMLLGWIVTTNHCQTVLKDNRFLKTNRNVVLIGCQLNLLTLQAKVPIHNYPVMPGQSRIQSSAIPSSIPPSCLIEYCHRSWWISSA